MAATPKDVHLLAHTARMLLVLEGKPKHVGGPEYRQQIKIYGQRWKAMSKAERAEVTTAAGVIVGMTKQVLTAAAAALEG